MRLKVRKKRKIDWVCAACQAYSLPTVRHQSKKKGVLVTQYLGYLGHPHVYCKYLNKKINIKKKKGAGYVMSAGLCSPSVVHHRLLGAEGLPKPPLTQPQLRQQTRAGRKARGCSLEHLCDYALCCKTSHTLLCSCLCCQC